MVSFDDAVCTFKSQIKVLKGHIFVKRVQNDAYNKSKAKLSNGDLLVHVDFVDSYRNDQQNEISSAYFGNQGFSFFTPCCYFKGATSEIRNKSVVVVTKNSDHNTIASMSCLKKVIDTMETECSKSFTNVALWSDGMGTQFRSRFIFQVLAGTMFLNKSLFYFYNGRHHGKGPMDGEGRTIKNVIFWKVVSGQIVVHTPKELSDVAMKFVLSIIIVYLSQLDEIVEPESIHQAPFMPKTLSIHKLIRPINYREDCSIEFFKMWQTSKLVMLLVVNVQGMVYRRWKWMIAISHLWTMVLQNRFLRLNSIFHLVRDGNNIFFISLIWNFSSLLFIYKI